MPETNEYKLAFISIENYGCAFVEKVISFSSELSANIALEILTKWIGDTRTIYSQVIRLY